MHVSFDPLLFRIVHTCTLPYNAQATKLSETSIVLLAFVFKAKDIVCTLICCIFG